jgi:glycosyltransferase involved in cell wall biosynthesis
MPDVVASVIVPTYNRPDALRCVLDGLLAQDRRDFECIIADDGSGPETAALVDSYRPRFESAGIARMHHVWHPDEGFRLAAIRNRASEQARAPWVIFLDGDCVPRRSFIRGHASCAKVQRLTRGSRVLMTRQLTEDALAERVSPHDLSLQSLLRLRQQGQINQISPLLGGVFDGLRHAWSAARLDKWKSVRTCNLALHRSCLERLGGFDERFIGWGLEDSEFVVRAQNAGLRLFRAPASTTVMHLWHREGSPSFLPRSQELLAASVKQRLSRTEHGMQRPSRSP